MVRRRQAVLERGLPYLVAELEGYVVGFCYASQFRPRDGYRFTVEDSIYVRPDCTGHRGRLPASGSTDPRLPVGRLSLHGRVHLRGKCRLRRTAYFARVSAGRFAARSRAQIRRMAALVDHAASIAMRFAFQAAFLRIGDHYNFPIRRNSLAISRPSPPKSSQRLFLLCFATPGIF